MSISRTVESRIASALSASGCVVAGVATATPDVSSVSSVVGAIALLLSVSSYPFFPQQTMINFSWTVLLLLSGLYMLIFAQMSRNYVLSRIASKPTGFTLDRVFVSQTVTFGVLPMVAFLGTRFPALGRILYSWTGPLLKIFN